MNEPIVIKPSLGRTVLFAIGSLAFSLLSLWFVFEDFEPGASILASAIDYLLKEIILTIGFFFFGYGFFFLMKKAILGKYILIVDEKGITDNSSATAFGFIPWTDIEEVRIVSLLRSDFIEVALKNEEYYINKFKGIRKAAVLANKKLGYKAMCITLGTSGVSVHKVFAEIQVMLEQAKSRDSS